MHASRMCRAAFALLAVGTCCCVYGNPIITFEGFPDSTILTTQYSGLTFTDATIFSAGISLNEFEFPPHSGANVAVDNGGPMTIDFASPVTSFGGYFTYLEPLTLAAFNASDLQVATTSSLFSTNDALFGDPGSSPNEFIDVSSAGGISSVSITGDPAGFSFTLDDATISGSTVVPEPGTVILFVTGFVGVISLRKTTISMKTFITIGLLVLTIVFGIGAVWLYARPFSVPVAQHISQPALPVSATTNNPAPTSTAPVSSGSSTTSATPVLMAFAGTHTVGTASATPVMITVNTPTPVTVTIDIADLAVISSSVNLLQLGASGTQPTIVGVMQSAGNGMFSLQHVFNVASPGQIQLEISAAFQGSLQRILSNVVAVSVWGVIADPTSGFTAVYPPDLYNITNTSTPPGLFDLYSSPAGVDIGGDASQNSPVASIGFAITIYSSAYTPAGNFDITEYLFNRFGALAGDASIAPVSVGGVSGYEVTFQNEEGGNQPLAVVYHNGSVYQIRYNSTQYIAGFSDQQGLNDFNAILQHFTFSQ